MSTATIEARLTPAELVRHHQAAVWRYLRYLGCDAAQADDVTQETFLAVLEKPFEQRSEAATAAYLRTVARNRFLALLRREKNGPTAADVAIAEEVWSQAAGAGEDEYLDSLDDCLMELTGRARRAIELRYRDDRSRREIAAELEMTEDGVKTLLRRTRDALRRCVERRVGA
ncbi:MAG: sigma-70 family RNA polymerase sigma factor [Planctomycetes bacterium]|nr:sigma-70 family RNA polymerase sigma factor [Planctomycetota bacterium]